MALRSKRSGQVPMISQMCVATELAITAVFSRKNPCPLKPQEGAAEAQPASMMDTAAPFLLRLGR